MLVLPIQVVAARPQLAASVLAEVQVAVAVAEAAGAGVVVVGAVFVGRRSVFAAANARPQLN